jgi:hypothetical protein
LRARRQLGRRVRRVRRAADEGEGGKREKQVRDCVLESVDMQARPSTLGLASATSSGSRSRAPWLHLLGRARHAHRAEEEADLCAGARGGEHATWPLQLDGRASARPPLGVDLASSPADFELAGWLARASCPLKESSAGSACAAPCFFLSHHHLASHPPSIYM